MSPQVEQGMQGMVLKLAVLMVLFVVTYIAITFAVYKSNFFANFSKDTKEIIHKFSILLGFAFCLYIYLGIK